jgi:predicted metalloendopeptidase
MDFETKSRAKDKANRMKDKYGFPPYLLNNTKIVSEYDGLVLKDNDDFWGYTWTINEWAIQNHNKKLRKPVDKVSFPQL